MKKIKWFFFVLVVFFILLVLVGCNLNPGTDIVLQMVTQLGGVSNLIDTTSIRLTFDGDPSNLTVYNITVKGATKGELTGTGTTRNLTISDITVANGENLTISISNPSGYNITGTPKDVIVYRSIITNRELVHVPTGTYNQMDTLAHSFNHLIDDFYMGKYEVTYQLWYAVYQWAISNGYNFANAGQQGNDGVEGAVPVDSNDEPVTNINWRDTIVWCNAYSELSGLTPCYTYLGNVIKDSRDSNATACDNAECNWSVNGYRLPTEGEWQYAASYKDGTNWTAYNYASGATADYNDAGATGLVAWYTTNSGDATHNIGTKNANQLAIFDMSGNV